MSIVSSKCMYTNIDIFLEEEGFVMLPELISKGHGDQKEVSVDIGKLKLRMYQGDITCADVDVIVNGTDPDMDLSKGNEIVIEIRYPKVVTFGALTIEQNLAIFQKCKLKVKK